MGLIEEMDISMKISIAQGYLMRTEMYLETEEEKAKKCITRANEFIISVMKDLGVNDGIIQKETRTYNKK